MKPMHILVVLSLVACAKAPPQAPAPEVEVPEAPSDPELDALRAEVEAIPVATDVEGLAAELAARVAIDQRLRRSVNHGLDDDVQQRLFEQISVVDAANTARMQEVVAAFGWPTISGCGKGCAFDAWLLVQHADQQPGFQREVLALMEPLAEQGEVAGKDFALLFDRVAVAEGRPQRFGSQGFCRLDGASDGWTPHPIEDEAQVDDRRAALGLMPMAHYRSVFDCAGELAAAGEAYEAEDWPVCAERYAAVAEDKAGPAAATPWYNAACCAALAGDPDAAFAGLSQALAAGFDDAELLATDPDLETLRDDPRWAELATPGSADDPG